MDTDSEFPLANVVILAMASFFVKSWTGSIKLSVVAIGPTHHTTNKNPNANTEVRKSPDFEQTSPIA